MTKPKAKPKTKAKKPPQVRHGDGDQWFTFTPVTERTEVETQWGTAIAEVGTYILTDSGDPTNQVICTQEDLDSMTSDPVPDPPPPGQAIMEDPPVPTFPDLPGEGKDHRHGS